MKINWKNRSSHDKGVIARTWAVVITMLVCGCFLDSDDYKIFLLIMIFGIAYLAVFSVVNYDRWE